MVSARQCKYLSSLLLLGTLICLGIFTSTIFSQTDNFGKISGTKVFVTSSDSVKLSLPDTVIYNKSSFKIPIRMEGLNVEDSVLAYQITLKFDQNALLAVGVTNQGTMTAQWNGPLTGIKNDTIVIADFTTNQPNTQLVQDHRELVKVSFLVKGLPAGQIFNNTVIYLSEATILTLNKKITVSNIKNGNVTIFDTRIPVEKNLVIHPGWNLVSLSITPKVHSLPDIFGDLPVEYVFGYCSGEGPRSWGSARPSFLNDLEILDGLHGYWIKSSAVDAQNWHISGNPIPVTTPILLYPGWNLIGYLPSSPDSVSHALASLDTLYSYVSGYQAGGSGPQTWGRDRPGFLNDLNILVPFSGYWIRMDSARTLVYPSGGYIASKNIAVAPMMKLAKISTVNIELRSCDFWAWQPDMFSEGDTIKVYDNDNVLCGKSVVVNGGGFLVHVSGDDPSTTWIDEGALRGEKLRFFVNGDSAVVLGTSADFDSLIIMGQKALFENMGSKRIKLMVTATGMLNHYDTFLPHEVSLAQNYPNPFNAETVISYRVQAPCKITLKIFDINGRLIKTLINRRSVKSGEYRIIWNGYDNNARAVSSGVYLIQLQAGKLIRNRKMLLLR